MGHTTYTHPKSTLAAVKMYLLLIKVPNEEVSVSRKCSRTNQGNSYPLRNSPPINRPSRLGTPHSECSD